MSSEDDNNALLVPSQPVAISRTGRASLATRGLHDLLEAESADHWLQKSRELFAQRRNKESVACIWRGLKVNPDHALLQLAIGQMYTHGWGVAQNDAEAVRWFRRAAEQGHVSAQYLVGSMYAAGSGVPKDYVQAAIYFQKAAEQGDQDAQYELGKIYDEGRGVAKDYVQAAVWYQKAAEQGYGPALYTLSSMYKDGRGVPQNDLQAEIWRRKYDGMIKALQRLIGHDG